VVNPFDFIRLKAKDVIPIVMYLVISEMLIFHAYDMVFLLSVIVVSHILSACTDICYFFYNGLD
jgi:hypothetical protein